MPTEKQEAATEDLHAKLKQLQEHIDKNNIKEKEAEEKLHMIKAQTMRARAAPLCLCEPPHTCVLRAARHR